MINISGKDYNIQIFFKHFHTFQSKIHTVYKKIFVYTHKLHLRLRFHYITSTFAPATYQNFLLSFLRGQQSITLTHRPKSSRARKKVTLQKIFCIFFFRKTSSPIFRKKSSSKSRLSWFIVVPAAVIKMVLFPYFQLFFMQRYNSKILKNLENLSITTDFIKQMSVIIILILVEPSYAHNLLY